MSASKLPDAKIIAMINDLSPEALCSLICFSSTLETKFRQLVCEEHSKGNIDVDIVINAWTSDD